MNDKNVIGVQPWLPGFLGRSAWWTEPIRAERLAALRIGLAAVLLLDILVTYLPNMDRFFGAGSLGCPQALQMRQDYFRSNWSLLRGVEAVEVYRAAVIVWAASAAGLLLGLFTRMSAIIAWCLALSIRYVNPEIHNAGDVIRNIILFYLMLCPCGAAWSVDAWLRRRTAPVAPGPAYVYPWPVRLLFVQLVVIYFFNGLYKVVSPHWREGDVLYYVLANPMWGRWSYAELPTPYFITRIATWTTMLWELFFPLLVLRPRSKAIALWLGVVFHVGILVSMELGAFPLYMMCMYLAEAPWERFAYWRRIGISS